MARRSNGEGTAPKQKKDGTWYRAIRIEGTDKRKYLYAKTKAELEKKYKEFTKQVSSETYVDTKKQSVENYMQSWLTVHKKIELKPKSYDTLECTIKYQIIPYFKGKNFFSVTHDDVQKFINKLDMEKEYSHVNIEFNSKTVQTNNSNETSLDQIKELKELLDIGAITQEEFNAKKKQLLNL